MARQTDGQITPAARPVQAFLQPTRVSLPEPSRPVQLPGMGQPAVVQQGATPSVQGANAFESLAQNLEVFNRQLTPTLQQLGLQYADQQMRRGEELARAQALKGLAQNDAAMEQSEAEHAKANRKLARKDPAAGEIMALLNPYRQMGFERGMAKMAGAEIAMGLPAYIEQRGHLIDALAPDQGQGAVRKLTDEYSAQLMQRYGLTAETPAFQRFAAPEIEKAREKIGLQIAKDRKDLLDQKSIDTAAAMMKRLYDTAITSRYVEADGTRYALTGSPADDQRFYAVLRGQLQQVLNQSTTLGVLQGEGRKRQQAIFTKLAQQGWFGSSGLQQMVGSLESSEPFTGEDGKPVLDPATGKPKFFLRLEEVYANEDLDARIKYGAAGRDELKAARTKLLEGAQGFDTYIWNKIGGMAPGPERELARDAAVGEFWNKNLDALEKLDISLLELVGRSKKAGDIKTSLYFESQPDPLMPERELADMATRAGSAWNLKAEIQRGELIARQFRDQAKGAEFLAKWNRTARQYDQEYASMGKYKDARDESIKLWATQNLNTYYGPSDKKNQGDRNTSLSRQWQAAVPYVNKALMDALAAKKGAALTDSEVRAIAGTALSKYGTGPDGDRIKAYLFPGSREGAANTPGVTPKTKLRNFGYGPTPKPLGTGALQPYDGKLYSLKDLGAIPDQKLLLRKYASIPIFNPPTLRSLVDDVIAGRPWPKAFERAWRDAGAPNGGEFLLRQIDHYDKGDEKAFDLPEELRRQVQKRASAAAGAGDFAVSQQATYERFPNLAAVGGQLMNVVFGVAPASAASMNTSYQAPVSGRNWTANTANGAALVTVADRLGLDPADLAAIFSFETGGSMSPSEPGRGAAAGRVGLIQAGPNERRAYGIHSGQTFAQQLEGVARYLTARGVRPGMGLVDVYAAVNGGNVGAGWRADGNGTVARSEATRRRLLEHRVQAIRRLGLSPRN